MVMAASRYGRDGYGGGNRAESDEFSMYGEMVTAEMEKKVAGTAEMENEKVIAG